jgi:hypothetical protein
MMTFLQPCWSLSKASSTSRSGTRSVSIRSLPLATLDRSWRMASSHISGEAGALSDPAHSMSGSRLDYFAMVGNRGVHQYRVGMLLHQHLF